MDKKDLNEVEDIDVEENIEDEDIEDNDEELDEGETFTYKIDNNNHSSSSDDSLKSIIYISVGVILLVTIIVVLIIFVNKGNSKTHEYSDIESRMTSGASKYYAKHSDLLPVNEGNSISIDASTLIENSYLKPFSEMVKEGVSCSGSVSVTKTGNEYVYFPYLDCGSSYKSELLSSKIIENSTVTGGDGLYNYNDYYVFRGEYPKNYVKFDDKKWRIIRINNDNSLKLLMVDEKLDKSVWDDRYNASKDNNYGINDFSVSRILEFLKSEFDVISERIPTKNECEEYIKNRQILIGKKDGALVGCIIFSVIGKTMLLNHIVVKKEFRSLKIGQELLQKAINLASEANRFILWVKSDNEPAIKLYEKFGYKMENLKNFTFYSEFC